jgi:imidazolonepropionase-like amidohydrolase
MRIVCDRNASLSALDALEMVTTNPAAALRRSSDLGCIAPKARADLIALPIAPNGKNIYEEIVWHREPIEWLMVNGQMLC